MWGDKTAPYHWVNILLHAFSALLVAKILRRLQIPGAWIAAGLFALHPVEVESVAWVSELKNTLSGVFYLSAALVYLGFDRNRNARNYFIALGLFLLGLMSKTVVATLPAALLVVFWWQRGKLSLKRDVLPPVPLFAAGIGAGLLTAWVERKFIISTQGAEYQFSMIQRCLIAGRGIWFYLGKLCWPVDLVFIYPRWNVSQTAWWQYLLPAAALALFAVLVWRRWRGTLAAMFFFAGALFPALGFFDVYPFRYSFVADHFQYHASLGPLTLAAVGLTRVKKTSVVVLLLLGALTWRQCGMYADAKTLWQATVRENPESWMARSNLGIALEGKGQFGEAIGQFREAVRLKPDYAPNHYNLGFALGSNGHIDEAIRQFQEAIRLDPDYAIAHNNLGTALGISGKTDEAIFQFQEAIRLNPNFTEARDNLARALKLKDAPAGHSLE
jgi:tetratricopeptide (TPR) repeat protein